MSAVKSKIVIIGGPTASGKTAQNHHDKMQRGTITVQDIEQIAEALDVNFRCDYILQNGEII